MPKTTESSGDPGEGKYEFRVWGEHKKARKLLAKMASDTQFEEVEDCYFLVDDPDWNAKVRDNTLKLKQLLDEERGFERWASSSYSAAEATPAPFDDLFDDLRLKRAVKGKSFDLAEAVDRLDPDTEAKAVFVTKHRTRHRIGGIRAEVTDITVHATGEVLETIAIVGDDLDELVSLRKELGLKHEENVAVHVAIETDE